MCQLLTNHVLKDFPVPTELSWASESKCLHEQKLAHPPAVWPYLAKRETLSPGTGWPYPGWVGDPTLGDPTLGDFTLGDLSLGDLTLGDLTLGDPTLGDLTLGDLTLGDPTLGDLSLRDWVIPLLHHVNAWHQGEELHCYSSLISRFTTVQRFTKSKVY